MENKRFLTANDVAEYRGISVPMAYKIIRRLNDELVAAGYVIVSGRIRGQQLILRNFCIKFCCVNSVRIVRLF